MERPAGASSPPLPALVALLGSARGRTPPSPPPAARGLSPVCLSLCLSLLNSTGAHGDWSKGPPHLTLSLLITLVPNVGHSGTF